MDQDCENTTNQKEETENVNHPKENEHVMQSNQLLQQVIKDLYKLLTTQTSTDCTCLVGKRETPFQCHQLILSIRSSVLKRMIIDARKQKPNEKIEVFLPNISSEIFKHLLHYMYTGEMVIVKGLEIELLKATILLGIEDGRRLLRAHLARYITPEDACSIIEEAHRKNHKELYEICIHLIENQADQVLKSESFYSWSKENLSYILQHGKMNIGEYEIFQAVVRWSEYNAKKNGQTLKYYFQQVEEFIRYALIPPTVLLEKVEPLGLVSPQYLLEAYKFHALPDSHKTRVSTIRTKFRGGVLNFKFDRRKIPDSIQLSKDCQCASLLTDYQSRTIVGDVLLSNDVYYWEIQIENGYDVQKSQIMIGVTDPSTVSFRNFLANNPKGYGLYGFNGLKHHNGHSYQYGNGPFSSGTVVGVLLDLRDTLNGKLAFFLNSKPLGLAFTKITSPMVPAVTLYNRGDIVRIIHDRGLPTNWEQSLK